MKHDAKSVIPPAILVLLLSACSARRHTLPSPPGPAAATPSDASTRPDPIQLAPEIVEEAQAYTLFTTGSAALPDKTLMRCVVSALDDQEKRSGEIVIDPILACVENGKISMPKLVIPKERLPGGKIEIEAAVADEQFTGVRRLLPDSARDWKTSCVIPIKEARGNFVILATLPEGVDDAHIVFSPDARRVAYTLRQDGAVSVVTDGARHGPYEQAGPVRFSADGRRVCFTASRNGKACVVLDGMEKDDYEEVSYATFSPDGSRFAYVAGDGGAHHVVVDGRTGDAYDGVSRPVFSANGRRVGYVGLKNGSMFPVVDGVPGKPQEDIRELTFSPDGSRVGYLVKENYRGFAVVDGVPGEAFDGVSMLTFSPDGRRAGYFGMKGGRDLRWFPVIDGVKGAACDDVLEHSLTFSPDGTRTAYAAMHDGTWHAVVDGAVGPGFDGVSPLQFSPDGRRVAYIEMRNRKGYAAVIDGVEQEPFDDIEELRFSPDGRRVGYLASKSAGFLVLDGEKRRIPGIARELHLLTWSPDSGRVACIAWHLVAGRAAVRVFVDGDLPDELDRVWNLTFSPDGKLLSYGARKGRELWWRSVRLQ